MTNVAELTRLHAGYEDGRLTHLQRLVASWGPLADVCFADLLLFVPIPGRDGLRFVVTAQVRPTTSQTVHRSDLVGLVVDERQRALVARAWRTGEITEGEVNADDHERVRMFAIPVRFEDATIAVCSRESRPSIGRVAGELERTYADVFRRFARMIAAGTFPFASEDPPAGEAPRVGDGALVLNGEGRVDYASPNAVSALHRLGIHQNVEGSYLSDLGLEESAIRTAYATGAPVTEEIERGPDVTVQLRCLPLLEEGWVTGALALMRDVSELRRRDRLLISMDATIREIHHRVKNNLQTISSLLRLQGRRLESPEAKSAIEESVRRVRSIALVHETLAREAGDDVAFNDIVRPLVRMVEEGLNLPDRPVRFEVEGDAGTLPARIATPLAVVLTELMQNAVDHAFPDLQGTADELPVGHVVISMEHTGDELCVLVIDDGVGLPLDFVLEDSSGLGLTIVRSLVTSQVEGTISMRANPSGRGTEVQIKVPVLVPQHLDVGGQ